MGFPSVIMILKVILMLWRPEHALSYAVAIWADTSSNQAIKDPGQRRCGYSNLGKIIVAATFVAARTFAGKFLFPDMLRLS
jgi:hypothetical protein